MNTMHQSIAEFGGYEFCQLGLSDLDQILAIEQAVYTHPWTYGNFVDTFQHEHEACGIRDEQGHLVAYFFLMPVVDELHLLTFAVDTKKQKLGYGYILLRKMMALAREKNSRQSCLKCESVIRGQLRFINALDLSRSGVAKAIIRRKICLEKMRL